MRIGYLYDLIAYPPKGGNTLHVTELVQGFLQNKHSVFVVDDPSMPGVTNFNDDLNNLTKFIKSIEVLYIRIDARFTRKWHVLTKCMDLLGNIPIVWEINSPANEGLAYSWLGGRSILPDTKEGITRRIRRLLHASQKLPGIWMEEIYRRKLAKNVHSAICVSSVLGKYASDELNIKNILILPNGGPLLSESEILLRRKKRKNDRFTVLYTGSSIYPWQGLDYLTQIIRLAESKAPDILFILAVNKIVSNLPKNENTHILCNLKRDEILDIVCGADACVSLHPEYTWSKYGFHNSPIKMFEYMACMVPVLATNHGQMKEIIMDGVNGLLCKDDPHDILNKLLFLREHKDEAAGIGRKGWENIHSEYNWPNNVSKTLKIFEKVIKHK